MAEGCVRITLIKGHRRSRGRAATRTLTLLRGVRIDAEPADMLRVLSAVVPLVDGTPAACRFNGTTYEIERIETRRDRGAILCTAHFVGEREIFRAHARAQRKLRRTARRHRESAARAERRARAERVIAFLRARTACAAPTASGRLSAASASPYAEPLIAQAPSPAAGSSTHARAAPH